MHAGWEAGVTQDPRVVTQQAIEVILMRQLATYLDIPVFIIDVNGNLVFYNEPAQVLLGKPYEENDEMPEEEWGTLFQPTSGDGTPIPAEELPLSIALREHRPAHLSPFLIRGEDGTEHNIAATAFPLVGQQNQELGAAVIFWEVSQRA
jgi:PAS domain-containing protein